MNPGYITAGVSMLFSLITGLIAWGLKMEVRAMHEEFRAELAEAENRFYARVNGNYIKKDLCDARRCGAK